MHDLAAKHDAQNSAFLPTRRNGQSRELSFQNISTKTEPTARVLAWTRRLFQRLRRTSSSRCHSYRTTLGWRASLGVAGSTHTTQPANPSWETSRQFTHGKCLHSSTKKPSHPLNFVHQGQGKLIFRDVDGCACTHQIGLVDDVVCGADEMRANAEIVLHEHIVVRSVGSHLHQCDQVARLLTHLAVDHTYIQTHYAQESQQQAFKMNWVIAQIQSTKAIHA